MIYLATIVNVGSLVADGLAENMLITFLHSGPPDCLDYAVSLSPTFMNSHTIIAPGDKLQIDMQDYLINAVGEDAQTALFELGHLTLIFDAEITPRHRGALHLVGLRPLLNTLKGDFAISETAV